jgi:NAD(P)-dependent dehydrogenase (short-subunit alcohol dehydrogenase family)
VPDWGHGSGPRVALVTGAGHGLGAGTAEALAARGWSVALVDLDLAAAEAAAGRIGDRAAAFAADISDSEAVEAAVAGTVERFGGIDFCFANAGIASGGALRHADPEVFAINIEVNLIGSFRTVRACLPHLVESKGYVLLNASASALMAPPGIGAYGASKAGVESMGDTLRREVAHLGVDVGVLYLLWVDTDMVTGLEQKMEGFAKLRAAMRGPMAKTMPRGQAVARIVAGIEGRRRRTMAPRWLYAFYRLRGFIGRIAERDLLEMAPMVDEVTLAEVSSRGLDAELRTDTPAGAAAAQAVAERR